ncbi:MAG: hypothetical protein Kow00105_14990 [Phycisphaeraceae bacterium]
MDGSNVSARLVLLLVAMTSGITWFILLNGWHAGTGLTRTVILSLVVCDAVILLSYVEALGVWYFSRRRGWRIPMKLAERLVCYSAIGWWPAAVSMALAVQAQQRGLIDRWMSHLIGGWEPWQSIALLVLIAGLAMLWFETLVWIGVRKTRFANQG